MKRRHFFIRKDYQGRFMVTFLLVSFIGTAIAIYTFEVFSIHKINSILYSMRLPSGTPGMLLEKEMLIANAISIAFVVIATLTCLWAQRKRATGPLLRIQKEVAYLRQGHLGRDIRLRESDDFKELSPKLQAIQAYCREQIMGTRKIRYILQNLILKDPEGWDREELDELEVAVDQALASMAPKEK